MKVNFAGNPVKSVDTNEGDATAELSTRYPYWFTSLAVN